MENQNAKMQITNAQGDLQNKLEKAVDVIKVQLVGRLVRPTELKDLVYEV